MKFNPITKELFSNKDELIKKMNCPLKVKWSDLIPLRGEKTYRDCSHCKHQIIDTSFFSDEELLEMIKENPQTCFKVNLNQTNIELI